MMPSPLSPSVVPPVRAGDAPDGARRAAGSAPTARELSPVGATLLIWAALAAVLLISMWAQMRASLVSQDDAMRLVELRRFLHEGSWFDATEPRLGFAPGYLTHWSRLIDAPLAALTLAFAAIGGPSFGEDAARAIWPLLLLLPLFLSLTSIAGGVGGRAAALRAPLLALMCLGGLFLFLPGRIHHHNTQMTLAAVFVALSLKAPRSRKAALAAGAVGALALAVGLESLAVLGIAAAGYALRFALDPKKARHFGAFGLSIALCGGALFLATVPPHLWSATQCDAYAVNFLGALAAAGLGAAVTAGLAAKRGRASRFLGLAGTGGRALALYALADPSCLTGPFGHIDPEIWSLWLGDVGEMRSVASWLADEPWHALFLFIAMAIAGLVALPFLWRRNRAPEALILGALLIFTAVIGAIHIRGALYANWLAVPVIAAASTGLRFGAPGPGPGERGQLLRPRTLLLAALVVLAGVATVYTRWRGAGEAAAKAETDAGTCSRLSDYAALARLPPGLVLPYVDLGTYVLATTEHRVLVAPYHRLQKELIFARRLGAGDPSAAEGQLRDAGVDYLVDCRNKQDPVEDAPTSLRTAMTSGHAPAFLEPLAQDSGSPLMIWRVRK